MDIVQIAYWFCYYETTVWFEVSYIDTASIIQFDLVFFGYLKTFVLPHKV
jgi:hypothetical protein